MCFAVSAARYLVAFVELAYLYKTDIEKKEMKIEVQIT